MAGHLFYTGIHPRLRGAQVHGRGVHASSIVLANINGGNINYMIP